jgi:hypothetical protein
MTNTITQNQREKVRQLSSRSLANIDDFALLEPIPGIAQQIVNVTDGYRSAHGLYVFNNR